MLIHFIVNGEDTPVMVPDTSTVSEAAQEALRRTRNSIEPLSRWELVVVGGARPAWDDSAALLNRRVWLNYRIGHEG